MPRVLAFFNIVSAAKRLNVEVTEQLIPKSFEDISFAFDLPQRLAAQKRGNQMAQRQVYCIGTLDTKREDVQLLSESVSAALAQFSPSGEDIQVVIVDVSTKGSSNEKGDGFEAFVKTEDVLLHHPDPSKRSVEALPSSRGEALSIMGDALANLLRTRYSEGSLLGAIGLGGSGGTALIAPALRSLPLGIPKVLISTVASGNAAPYIGTSDLILVPSVVDIAGLNTISRKVLPNAAAAFAGMVARSSSNDADTSKDDEDKISVGMTMFGVTTPCITAMQDELEGLGFETIVFHATGNGGRAMEELVGQGLIKGVIDVTTTEVADVIVGGVMACAETRFEETLKQQVPLVLSAGALDMVNFGPRNTVPPQFANRNLLIHNDQVTVMRTTVQESQEIARFIAKRLNKSTSPVRVLLPEKGVSLLDASGMPFEDLEARSALFETLEQTIEQTPERQVKRLPYNVNDPEFSKALVAAYLDLIPKIPTKIQQQNGSKESSNNVPLARSRKLQIPRLPRAKPGTLQNYKALLNKLWAQIEQGVPIVGAGAGTGISAKFEEQGGADLIVVYNSGRFRMAGRGSLSGLLPFKDANAVVLELASEVIPIVKHAPVLAGVCATDPFRQQSNFLRELESMGFQGVQNFPTVGLYDGIFRQNLEETGMGYGLEVEMIRQAHEMGLLTSPYVFNEAEARVMVEVGADIIVAHMGLTTSGSIGASSGKTLEQSVTLVQKIADAAREINEQIIVLCHGGPIAAPEDAEFVLQRTTGVHGFYGASSLERLPVEEAITNTVRRYKATKLNK